MSLAPPPHQPADLWRPTATYFLIFIGIGMMGGILGPALPFLAEQSGSSMSQIAILFTARALGNMAGSLLSGQVIDKAQGHTVVLCMAVLAVLGMIFMPVSPMLWVMTALVCVLGFAEVSMNTTCNVMIMWWHRGRAGPFISTLHFCFGLGSMLAPLIVMLAIRQDVSVIWAFWFVAAYVMLAVSLLIFQPSPVNPARGDSQYVEKPYDKVVFFGLLVLFGLYVGMEITFAGWVTTYGVVTGLSPGDAAFLVSVFWFSLSGGRLLAIPLLRLRHYTPLLYGCFLLGFAMMAALYFDALPIILITLIYGLAMAAIFPTLFTLGNELMSLNGKRTGTIFFGVSLGALIAPSLTGPLIEHFGARALPLLLMGILITMTAGLSLILWRQSGVRL